MGNIPSQAHVDLAAHVNNFHLKTGEQITQMKADALNHRLNEYETSILPDWLSDTCLFILLLTTIGLLLALRYLPFHITPNHHRTLSILLYGPEDLAPRTRNERPPDRQTGEG